MKSFKHFIALLLAVTLLLTAGAAFQVSAADADADIIEIGDGTSYKNISAYINGNPNYAGKTFRLVSDITESKPTLTKSCTIDGNGFTVNSEGESNACYLITGSGAADQVKVEIKNVRFTSTSQRNNFTCLYVRTNSAVTLTDCSADASIPRVVSLQNLGDCHLTVNSGIYWASNVFLKHDFAPNTDADLLSTVDINGGFFGLSGTETVAATDLMTCLFNAAGKLALNINGGVFYSPVKAPLVYQKYVGASAPAPSINLAGGTFYLPEEQTLLFGRQSSSKTYAQPTVTIGEKAVLLRTLKQTERIPTAIDASTSALDFTPADLTFTTATDALVTLGGQTFAALTDGAFDGVADAIDLTADSAATAVFARTPLFKNGCRADGLTGNTVVQNFGESAYVQYRTNADGSFDARLVLAFTDPDCEIAALTVTNPENGKHETIAVTVSYLAFLAEGRTVTAEDCGGTRLLIVSIGGLTDEHSGKTLHISATLSTGAVSHTSRTYALTLEKPAA